MKAAIYCRISRDMTGEEAGVTRQLEDCRALAEQMGWHVVAEFTDNDISATSGKPRPGYRELLAAIKAGEVDALIAWHPDRLYRKLADLEELIKTVDAKNVVIRTVRAGEFDLSTATGKMLARILGSVSQGEGELKSERWRRSIRQRREAGQAPGWGPRLFGYTRDGQIIPDEAEVIRWAADTLISGGSIRKIATDMTKAGKTTTLGNPWSTQALSKLMQNARLAGHSTLNGDTVGVGTWQPILSTEVFEQVQSTFAVRRGSAPRVPRVSLLVGLIRCAECGTRLTSGRLAKREGESEGRRVYKCPRPPRADGCGRIAIGAEPVEEMVEAYAQARLEDPAVRAHLSSLTATSGDKTAEVVGLEERLRELEAQLDEPGIPVATIMRAMDRTRERIEELRASVVVTVGGSLPARGSWPPDLARRARLVRLVVADVKVSPVAVRGRNAFDPERVTIEPR